MERKQTIAGVTAGMNVKKAFTVGRVHKSCAKHCHQECGSLLPHCIVCGEIPERGIMGGIFVQGQFLCDECEQNIVTLDGEALSNEEYLAVADKLKGLWKMA